MSDQKAQLVTNYYESRKKTKGAAFFLAFLFGPVGLFYSNWVMALILTVAAVAALPFSALVVWVISILVAVPMANTANEKIMTEAQLKAAVIPDSNGV